MQDLATITNRLNGIAAVHQQQTVDLADVIPGLPKKKYFVYPPDARFAQEQRHQVESVAQLQYYLNVARKQSSSIRESTTLAPTQQVCRHTANTSITWFVRC